MSLGSIQLTGQRENIHVSGGEERQKLHYGFEIIKITFH